MVGYEGSLGRNQDTSMRVVAVTAIHVVGWRKKFTVGDVRPKPSLRAKYDVRVSAL